MTELNFGVNYPFKKRYVISAVFNDIYSGVTSVPTFLLITKTKQTL